MEYTHLTAEEIQREVEAVAKTIELDHLRSTLWAAVRASQVQALISQGNIALAAQMQRDAEDLERRLTELHHQLTALQAIERETPAATIEAARNALERPSNAKPV